MNTELRHTVESGDTTSVIVVRCDAHGLTIEIDGCLDLVVVDITPDAGTRRVMVFDAFAEMKSSTILGD